MVYNVILVNIMLGCSKVPLQISLVRPANVIILFPKCRYFPPEDFKDAGNVTPNLESREFLLSSLVPREFLDARPLANLAENRKCQRCSSSSIISKMNESASATE